MAENREGMKLLLTQFVDQLLDAEVATVKEQISSLEKVMTSTVTDLRNEMTKSMDEFRKESQKELSEIRKLANSLRNDVEENMRKSSKEVEEKLLKVSNDVNDTIAAFEKKSLQHEAEMDETFQSMAEKVSNTLENTKQKLDARVGSLEGRVAENEKTLDVARSDHDKLTSVLSIFATNLNTVSAVPPTPAAAPAAVFENVAPVQAASAVETAAPVIEPAPVVEEMPVAAAPVIENVTPAQPAPAAPVVEETINLDLSAQPEQQGKEFEIDLSEVEFQATDNNPHMDVVVDENGQHIYKPFM